MNLHCFFKKESNFLDFCSFKSKNVQVKFKIRDTSLAETACYCKTDGFCPGRIPIKSPERQEIYLKRPTKNGVVTLQQIDRNDTYKGSVVLTKSNLLNVF